MYFIDFIAINSWQSLYYNIKMEYTYFFMRHAQSAHNIQKQMYRKNSTDKSYKKKADYKKFKVSPHLIDPNCVNQQQINAIDLQPLNMDKVALVLTSPLKRCLMTCQKLLNGRNDIAVMVQPNLNSRLCAAWSIGSSAKSLISQFPLFDFSRLDGKEDTWMFDFLSKDKVPIQNIVKNKDRLGQYLLSELSQGKEQNYSQFLFRCRLLPDKIKQIVSNLKYDSDKNQILIIAHSCTLKYMICQQFDERGKARCDISFEHLRPKLCISEWLFKQQAKL